MKKILKRTVLIAIAFVVTFGTSWSSTVAAVGEACPEIITRYSADAQVRQLVRGSDGAMWFLGESPSNSTKIGRIAPDGSISHYSISGTINRLTTGPNNELWASGFDSSTGHALFGKILTDGTFFNVPLSNTSVRMGIFTFGPDGAFWGGGTAGGPSELMRITTSGTVTIYPQTGRPDTPNYNFSGFASGPDNAVWFTAQGDGNQNRYVKAGKINPADGAITWFDLDHRYDAEGSISDFIAGPDNTLWYTVQQNGEGRIGRMTTAGIVIEYQDPAFSSFLPDITFGPDGNLWFVNSDDGFGRVELDPFNVDLYHTRIGLISSTLRAITFGPNDTAWLNEQGTQNISKVSPVDLSDLAFPTGIELNDDANIPNMHWNAVPGASSYVVCRDGVVAGETAATTHNDVTSTGAHYYTIIARNSAGEYSSPGVGIEMYVDYQKPTVDTATFSLNPLPKGEESILSVTGNDDSDITGAAYSIDGGPLVGMQQVGSGIGNPTTPPDEWRANFIGEEEISTCSGIGCPASTATILEAGVHTFTVYTVDYAMRLSDPRTLTLTVGLVAPADVSAVKSPTNTTPQLTWSAVGGATEYRIYRDGATTPITTTTATTYTDSTTLSDGNHTYTVSAADATTETAQSQPVSVMVDKTAPVASNITVNPALIVVAGNLNISANASDALSGVAGAEYFIDTDPGQGNATPMTYNSTTGKVTATKNITFNSLSRGTHSVKVRVKDAAGNWSTLLSRNFVYL